MNAPNTQGLLKFSESAHEANQFSIHNETGNWLLSVRHNGEQMPSTQLANLARLVACWNACDGISTKELEQRTGIVARTIDAAVGFVGIACEQRDDVTAQRDALLAAANKLSNRGFFAPVSCADAGTLEDMAAMRAAIAIGKPQPEQPAANNEPATNQSCPGDLPKCKWEPMQPYGSKCATCGDIVPF